MPFSHFVVNFINQQASAEERELQGFPADQGYLNLVTSLAVSAVQGLNTGKFLFSLYPLPGHWQV